MIKIDLEKYIKDRAWFGFYWTGTVFPRDHDMYWCKIRSAGLKWATGVVVTEWKSW